MAGIKIVDLPAVGRDLAATDLFEMSLVGGTGSRKITGQEIMNASKLSVNNTPVINGTAGRIFFQGSTNVLQQSSNLFWNNTNGRLGIGTNTPLGILHLKETATTTRMVMDGDAGQSKIITFRTNGLQRFGLYLNNIAESGGNAGSNFAIRAYNDAGSLLSTPLYIHRDSGNIGVNTTVDSGFKLDVNGTARVGSTLTLNNNILMNAASATNSIVHNSAFTSSTFSVLEQLNGNNIGGFIINTGTGESRFGSFRNGGGYFTTFYVNNAELIRLSTSNNVLIGTTTDDGFRLDVNGTARTKYLTIESAATFDAVQFKSNTGVIGYLGSDNGSAWIASGANLGGSYLTVSNTNAALNAANNLIFRTAGTERARFHISTGNFSINSGTDAGFRLDVNGTARVQGLLTGTNGINISGGNSNVYGLTFNSGGIGATGQGLWTDGKTNIQQSQGPRTNGGAAYLLTAYVGSNYDTVQLVNNGTTNCLLIQGGYASSNQPQFNVNILNLNNTYNFTTGTTLIKGIYYNPVLTSMTGVTAHHAFHSTSGRIRFEGLPTSPTGLSAGDLYNDGGIIKIV
jgi:hypothetical protein